MEALSGVDEFDHGTVVVQWGSAAKIGNRGKDFIQRGTSGGNLF
jgi:hypothetical protein